MAIKFENASYTYMDGTAFSHAAISGINFSVAENEFVGIIGHTGSGKSTLISHMNGILQPDSGFVTVDGFDVHVKKARKHIRQLVGIVFQYPEYQLFEETVEKDIAYGVINQGISEMEVKNRVLEAMRLVGLEPKIFLEKSPFELSGGEKRRTAIAGIIAMRPKYLVMDEPMAGLDPFGRTKILETIVELKKALGCAVIMVSHSMDDIASVAERVVVMNEGKIVLEGTPKEVFSKYELLNEIGLGVPQGAKIAAELRNLGVDVPSEIFDINELFDYIKEKKEMGIIHA